MEKIQYKIVYLHSFTEQLNNILYYITYELNNKIAAEKLYKEIFKKIEIRSFNPTSFQIFKKTKNTNINWYKIRVKNYTIFYTTINNSMVISRIYYSRRNFDRLI